MKVSQLSWRAAGPAVVWLSIWVDVVEGSNPSSSSRGVAQYGRARMSSDKNLIVALFLTGTLILV